jgi:uncharacterized membrane protein (UPF0127 family)
MNYVIIEDQKINCDLALTTEEQRRGLMYETSPKIMAFIYEKPAVRKFWMYDTYQPLGLLFCKEGKIDSIYQGTPFSLKLIGSDEPCDLVIELPVEKLTEWNIQPQQRVKISYSLKTIAQVYERKYHQHRKL